MSYVCQCGHAHTWDMSQTYASQGPACDLYWNLCDCTSYKPVDDE